MTEVIKILFFTGIFLAVGTMASAGCNNFEDGSMGTTPPPQYRICYDDVCDVTQLSYICANAYEIRRGFANGWATHTTLEPAGRSVTWQGRPIADEKLSRLTIEEIYSTDAIAVDDTSFETSLTLLSSNSYLGPDNDCLPLSELELSGVRDGTSVSDLVGRGMLVVLSEVIPDFYNVQTFSHDGLLVFVQGDTVVEAYSSDPKWITPSGLRVGLTRAEVHGILGRVPQRSEEVSGRYEIGICEAAADSNLDFLSLVIVFASDQRVEEIQIYRDWP